MRNSSMKILQHMTAPADIIYLIWKQVRQVGKYLIKM